MLMNPGQGWGFISTPKNGSTTVEALLQPHAQFAFTGPPQAKHLTIWAYEKHLQPMLDMLSLKRPHFFAVVREPVEYVYSFYRFHKGSEFADPTSRYHKFYTGDVSFEDFALAATQEEQVLPAVINAQSFYLVIDGRVAVDTVFKLDTLDDTLGPFLARFGIETGDAAPERRNVSEVRKTPDEVTDAAREAILTSPRFKRDLEIYTQAA